MVVSSFSHVNWGSGVPSTMQVKVTDLDLITGVCSVNWVPAILGGTEGENKIPI